MATENMEMNGDADGENGGEVRQATMQEAVSPQSATETSPNLRKNVWVFFSEKWP